MDAGAHGKAGIRGALESGGVAVVVSANGRARGLEMLKWAI